MAATGPVAPVALSILEQDRNSEVLWSWTFPAIPAVVKQVVDRKVEQILGEVTEESGKETPANFHFHFRDQWIYLTHASNSSEADNLKDVASFVVVMISKEFNPEKHADLAGIFLKQYTEEGNASALVPLFLSLTVKGGIGKAFKSASYDIRKAYIATSIKDVIKRFGVEVILIYVGVLLKKRIAVYSPDVNTLLSVIRTLPQLVWSRQDWEITRPWIDLEEDELKDISKGNECIFGCTSSGVESREDLYDLFVNISDNSVSVATHASAHFGMGKVHKDIATFLVSAVDDEEESDQSIVKELARKTKELVSGLMKLAVPADDDDDDEDNVVVTMEAIKARKMAPAMHTFLYNLAVAENLV